MNEQLTLITNEIHAEDSSRPSQSNNWWKLSKEEKELGLAGVRSIRSILQKYSLNEQKSIAKAS